MSEENKNEIKATRQNWADDSAGEDDETKEIGKAGSLIRPDHKVLEPKSLDPPVAKKNLPPPEHRERNQYGDFVVTKIVIPDLKPVVKEEEKNESSEEDEDDSEPEPVEETKEEPVKKEAVKLLSKKEKQKLEDEEFERVMKEVAANTDTKQAQPQAHEKQEEVIVDEKKHAANKKKKDKQKAKKAEEQKQQEESK